jgi:hypothetical protein
MQRNATKRKINGRTTLTKYVLFHHDTSLSYDSMMKQIMRIKSSGHPTDGRAKQELCWLTLNR